MKKYKKVYLYKLGRFQQDFEYLFPEIKIKNYIVDDATKIHNNIKCVNINAVKYGRFKLKHLIVICDRRLPEIEKEFLEMGLIEEKDYVFLETFGELLNEEIPKKTLTKIKKLNKLYDIDLSYKGETNSELFKRMIYTDAKYSLNCTRGFNSLQVHEQGFVYPCCKSWSIEYIGNAYHESPNKIWKSNRAKLFRLSLINKTYCFCNLDNCNLTDEGLTEDNLRMTDYKKLDSPSYISMAFDRTCNLKCKSCRDYSSNFNNNEIRKEVYDHIVKNLLKDKWLGESKQLHLAAQGEVFFSETYKKILDGVDKVDTLFIHTNGILLNKDRIEQISKKSDRVFVFVSMDAINEETYKNIRIGGNLKVLKRNLEELSKAKREGKIEIINILCVLQKGNYKELPELAEYAISLNADNLDVTKITNWGTYTDEEFKEISMYDENGNPKPELVKVLKNPIFKTDKINLMGNVFKDIIDQKSDDEIYKIKEESK